MIKWILHICVLLSAVGAASLAAAQTNVTTTGGSANSVPKFSGATTVENSAITDQSGVITFGPVTLPFSGSGGGIFTTGSNSGIAFVRQSLTSWPSTPAAGDLFSWYDSDGTARLYTYTTGNLLHIASGGQITVGPFQRTDGEDGGGITTVGTNNGLAFTRQTLTAWPSTPAAGDLFSWYDLDGTARLYTYQTGNVLAVKNTGELDLTGPLVFPDGSVQKKAQAVGPQGPQGVQGPTGPQGPPGPTLHSSASCFNSSQPIASCGCSRTISSSFVSNGNTCFVTSDTGSCNAGSTTTPPQYGACCSCAL